MKHTVFLLFLVLLINPAYATESTHGGSSKYAGQEKRAVKSLSSDDIKELQRGGGWGLAKAAELNGYPGPSHLLEMKGRISLTSEQVTIIETSYKQMKARAIELGERLITQEQALENLFQNGSVNPDTLRSSLTKIENTRMELRYTHLVTHLETPEILSKNQIEKYNALRGYSNPDPCAQAPEGHDAEMWLRHNGCT